jgi:hypothetical protein
MTQQEDLHEPHSLADTLKDEYRKLLSSMTLKELRDIAQRRNVPVEGTRKAPIVEQLSAQLCDRQSILTEMSRLDDLGRKLIVYLHLILPQGYGIPIEGIKFPDRHQDVGAGLRTRPPGAGLHTNPPPFQSSTLPSSYSQEAIYAQAIDLRQRGLLLTFKRGKTEGNATYYLLPWAVRMCIPPQPGLVPPCHSSGRVATFRSAVPGDQTEEPGAGNLESPAFTVYEQPLALLNQKLYQVWSYIAEQRPKWCAPPRRSPIEDQWPQLQGWNHLPSEIDEIGTRPNQFFANMFARIAERTGSPQALTVPVPAYHLCDQDRHELADQVNTIPPPILPYPHTPSPLPPDEEVEFYYALLAGFAAISGEPGQALQANAQAMQRLLSLSPSNQALVLSQAWKATAEWSEMDIVLRASDDLRLRRNVTYTTYKPQDLYEEWREGRSTVLRFLSLLEENCWIPVNALLQRMYETTPNLIHTRSHPGVWWLESTRAKKQFGATPEDWEQSTGQFVRAVIEGPMAWLGLVRLRYKTTLAGTSSAEAIQLTPVGSFVIGRRQTIDAIAGGVTSAFQPSSLPTLPAPPFVLHDDLTATLVPGYVPPQLYDLLSSMGELIASSLQQLTYRITAAGVQHMFDSGETAETLIAALERACGDGGRDVAMRSSSPPAAWKRAIEEWYQNYGQLHLYEDIALLELADEYVLQELMLNVPLREKIRYQFSPQLVAIHPDTIDELIQEMEKRGYTPRVE